MCSTVPANVCDGFYRFHRVRRFRLTPEPSGNETPAIGGSWEKNDRPSRHVTWASVMSRDASRSSRSIVKSTRVLRERFSRQQMQRIAFQQTWVYHRSADRPAGRPADRPTARPTSRPGGRPPCSRWDGRTELRSDKICRLAAMAAFVAVAVAVAEVVVADSVDVEGGG